MGRVAYACKSDGCGRCKKRILQCTEYNIHNTEILNEKLWPDMPARFRTI